MTEGDLLMMSAEDWKKGEIRSVHVPGLAFTHGLFSLVTADQKPGSLWLMVFGSKAVVLNASGSDCTPCVESGMGRGSIQAACPNCWGPTGLGIQDWVELIRFYLIQSQGLEAAAMTHQEAVELLDWPK